MKDGDVLVVESLQGLVNLPGGSSKEGEAARCAAHRETWEETGLNLQVGELIKVLDTGFHLYRCDFTIKSGEIDPPFRLEVRRAYLLSPDDFNEYEWRFPEQASKWQDLAAHSDVAD
jgi:8-oxo-dGTP diphosphatase